MPLVQAKCTNCGANLEIDNTKDAAICPYCGTAFIVEKAINNYNTTNQIHAGTVNIYGGNSADFVIRGGVVVKYNGAATEVVIPNNVKIIGGEDWYSGAFAGCAGIISVMLPDSLQEIGDSAFRGCSGLTTVLIPNSVQKIGRWAFEGCNALASVTIPDSVQEIGGWAFEGCNALASVTIPDSVQEIGSCAFSGCSLLASVTIPNSIQEIDQNAFSGCSSLRLAVIPNSVQKIGDFAFKACSSLTSVTIPNSVRNIGTAAFSGCTALRKVKIDGDPEVCGTAFNECDVQIVEASEAWKKKNCYLFGCLEEYRPRERRGGCYVATAVYGSYDCPEVWTLRRFRDDTLDRTWYGRAFIRTYYAVSPTLVRWFGTTGWFRSLFKAPLDRFVRKLRRRGVKDTPYQDKY